LRNEPTSWLKTLSLPAVAQLLIFTSNSLNQVLRINNGKAKKKSPFNWLSPKGALSGISHKIIKNSFRISEKGMQATARQELNFNMDRFTNSRMLLFSDNYFNKGVANQLRYSMKINLIHSF